MTKFRLTRLSIEEITIPSLKIPRDVHMDIVPSRVVSLANAINSKPHNKLPRLDESQLEDVTQVSIYIKGLEYGGSCPILSRDDFSELKRRYNLLPEDSLVDKTVIAVYSNSLFSCFIVPFSYRRDEKL